MKAPNKLELMDLVSYELRWRGLHEEEALHKVLQVPVQVRQPNKELVKMGKMDELASVVMADYESYMGFVEEVVRLC